MKIPTAEEILVENNVFYKPEISPMNLAITRDQYIHTQKCIKRAMIEFAKMHVKAAIKECIENAPSGSSTDTVSYEDVVELLTDCYPESNIK